MLTRLINTLLVCNKSKEELERILKNHHPLGSRLIKCLLSLMLKQEESTTLLKTLLSLQETPF